MRVDTKWFGTIEIGEDKIITFDKGIIGFDEYKRFTIIYDVEKSDSKTIMWLQSLDDENMALPVMNPEVIMEDYAPLVEDSLLQPLGSVNDEDILILVTLTVPSDVTKMTTNLKAPIIINTTNLKAIQIIAENENYTVKYPIYDIIKKNEKGGE